MARTITIIFEKKQITVSNIPDNAKITYAGIVPSQPGAKTNTLRIYKSSSGDNQLAIFRDVVSFIDSTLEVSEESEIRTKKVWE